MRVRCAVCRRPFPIEQVTTTMLAWARTPCCQPCSERALEVWQRQQRTSLVTFEKSPAALEGG